MRIAILGGTGDIGQGLALRLGYDTDHDVVIGSREPERARTKAEEYETELSSRGRDSKITGFHNEMAADRADVLGLAIPPDHIPDVMRGVRDRLDEDTIVVSPATQMTRYEGGFRYDPPSAGSVAAKISRAAPASNPVVGAFHPLSADRLANLGLTFDLDTPVFGDDEDAKEIVSRIAEDIEGLRAVDAGSLEAAPVVESLTPLIITLGIQGVGHDLGVKFQ